MTDVTIVDTPLPHQTQPNPPPRPQATDPLVRRAAAEAVLPDVIAWLGGHYKRREREHVISQLIEAMNPMAYGDGYAIARNLERFSMWDPDTQLVEVLDGDHVGEALREAVAEWVEANQIKPKLEIGAEVTFQKSKLDKGRSEPGTIVAIHADTAQYVVQTEEYLADSPSQRGKTCGYVVAFEAVEA